MRSFVGLLLLILLGLILLGSLSSLHPGYAAFLGAGASSPIAPAHTTSIYEQTVSTALLAQQGCTAAQDVPGLIILDFGAPMYSNGRFGTHLFSGTFASDARILAALKSFVDGAWNCHSDSTNLKIAIGTTNYNRLPDGNTGKWYQAGTDWGGLVDSVQQYIANNGYDGQLSAYGADDIEVAWASYSETASFVNGYHAATTQLLVDFGDDPGGANPSPWTAEQLWEVSSGSPNSAILPEIYFNDVATMDWEVFDSWACAHKGTALPIIGVITEYPYENSLSPDDAWVALYSAMGNDDCTAQARSGLTYLTNI